MAMQNIYDNETFFEGYKSLRENKANANVLFELNKDKLEIIEGKINGENLYINEMAVVSNVNVTPVIEKIEYKDHSAKLKNAYVIDYTVKGKEISAKFEFKI